MADLGPGPGEGEVELADVRRDPAGRLPGIPPPIGAFSSAAEAMLAVEPYESGAAPGPVADLAAARGFAGRESEPVLIAPGGDECVLEVGRARGPVGVRDPMTMEELDAGRRARRSDRDDPREKP